MDSIVKRRNRFNVVYLYTDANGNRKQKWVPRAFIHASRKLIPRETAAAAFPFPFSLFPFHSAPT